jgi:hypothetical protein
VPGHKVKHGHPKSEHRVGTHDHDAHPVAEHTHRHDDDGAPHAHAYACAVCGTPSHHPPPDGTDRHNEKPAVESADVESAVTSAVAQVRAEMEAQLEVRALPGAHANTCVCGVLWVVWCVGGV